MLLSHGSPSSHMYRNLIPGTRSLSTLALRGHLGTEACVPISAKRYGMRRCG
jgi:hypothetical protein